VEKLHPYLAIFAITAAFTALGIYGSEETGSLLLLAGALHLLGDGLPFVADLCNEFFVRQKRLSWLIKLCILLGNSLFLLGTTTYIAWEAYDRWQSPFVIGKWVLLFAVLEIIGNTLQARYAHRLKHLRAHDEGGHVHESQMGHLIGDIAASTVQGLGALGIFLTGALWIDPAASAFGALLTFILALKGLRDFFKLWTRGEDDEISETHEHAHGHDHH